MGCGDVERVQDGEREEAADCRKPLAVSVRLPFCPNTCQYCSMPSDLERALRIGPYCDALAWEAAWSTEDMADFEVTSVYLGGGAASYVKAERVCELLGLLRERLHFADGAEVTLRALPGYINELKVRDYLRAGVTAVDYDWHMGSSDHFRFTGRSSLPEQERASIRAFPHYGLSNVGFELRYGAPGQSCEGWVAVVGEALAAGAAHVSIEPFEAPAGSVLRRELANLRTAYGDRPDYRMPGADGLARMRDAAVEILEAEGLHEYLPGRFARPGSERRFLLDETRGVDRLELGVGGRSHIDGACSANVDGFEEYIDAALAGDPSRLVVRAWEA